MTPAVNRSPAEHGQPSSPLTVTGAALPAERWQASAMRTARAPSSGMAGGASPSRTSPGEGPEHLAHRRDGLAERQRRALRVRGVLEKPYGRPPLVETSDRMLVREHSAEPIFANVVIPNSWQAFCFHS